MHAKTGTAAAAVIAIVDDESVQRSLLRSYLETGDYRVVEAADAEELDLILAQQRIDLLLLDVMLPGRDGLSITRDIRSRLDLGIILVTRRAEDVDRILGLELGADDYIIKPFNPRELLARVKSVLRRSRSGTSKPAAAVIRFHDWLFDLHSRTLITGNGEELRLSRGEYQLLTLLVSQPGRLLTRERLMQALNPAGDEASADSRSIDVLIGRLRRKLNDDPKRPQLIITVYGEGYIFTRETY